MKGSTNSEGIFTARNPNSKWMNNPKFRANNDEPLEVPNVWHKYFEEQHPQLKCYTPSNELVISREDVSVEPWWRYNSPDTGWTLCSGATVLFKKKCRYDVEECYITVPPTESEMSEWAKHYNCDCSECVPKVIELEVEQMPESVIKIKALVYHNDNELTMVSYGGDENILDIMSDDEKQRVFKIATAISPPAQPLGAVDGQVRSESICIICDESTVDKSFCADCGLNKADDRKTENMSIRDFKTAYDKLESEKIVAVQIAHVYEYGYWKSYTASVYRVVSITPNEINLQNVNYENEWLMLNAKNLQSGQFKIEY